MRFYNVNEDGEYTNNDGVDFSREIQAKHCVYSDRLYQWDYEKYNTLRQKHFGNHSQSWFGIPDKKIEAFLSDYIGKKVILKFTFQGTNASNGYPYWRFDYDEA